MSDIILIDVYFSDACSIEDPDTETAVILGGRYTMTTVSVYGRQGWLEDLSSLNTGRQYHACTSYKTSGTRVTYYEAIAKCQTYRFYILSLLN